MDYPYHLISDEEMFDAFIKDSEECFFTSYYPCQYEEFRDVYDNLISAMKYHISQYLNEEINTDIPDWVYSYMLGAVIGPNSDQLERHYLLTMLNLDNIDDKFTLKSQKSIYDVSKQWLLKTRKYDETIRPATIFGEPHVIKSLRVSET